MSDSASDIEQLEMRLLLEGIFLRYGYDFRNYAQASLKRRVWKAVESEGLSSLPAFLEKIVRDTECMERFILTMSVDVTAMFRDPGFFKAFRVRVVPYLKTLPFIRVWHAGCSTGEEVFSLAILLKEEGLLDKTRLYATDMNEAVLRKAREGIFSLDKLKEHTANYLAAGGKGEFSKYYTAKYGGVRLHSDLVVNAVWAQHNLVTDSSFNEFHVIFCRNVMIYFNRDLSARVHKLIYESLAVSGILGLGSKESLRFTPFEPNYEAIDEPERLYRKKS